MDSQCRILLVDGDNANLLVMQQILDSAYEVEFAFTAREAAFRLASGSFDLIISGYTLPDMALPDFLSSIKRISKPREIPVIVMSDDDDPAVEENSFRLGAQDFISKNSRIGVIENRVMRVLELYQYRAGMERRYQEQEDKLERIRQNIVEAFASIIEPKFPGVSSNYKHSFRNNLVHWSYSSSGLTLGMELCDFKTSPCFM